MASIKAGDTVYIRKDFLDFREYQIVGIVREIRSVPKYSRGKLKLYTVRMEDGNFASTYYRTTSSKPVLAIRKTPFPDLPIARTLAEISEMRQERRTQ